MIVEIKNLPTYATQNSVIEWFVKVMAEFQNNRISKNELIDCVEELSDQQYHQYQFMPLDICNKIEQWALGIFDCKIKEDTETLILLSHCLAFSINSVQMIIARTDLEEFKAELYEMLEHVEHNRVNPYWDLNKDK